MKKALLYAVTAIFLGTVTMLAPLMLIEPRENVCPQTRGSEALDEGERTFEDGGVLERVVSCSNLLSAGLMLVPSFFFAVGVSLYLKKRTS